MVKRSKFKKEDKVKLLKNAVLEKTFLKGDIGKISKQKTGFIFESDDRELTYGVEVKFDNGYLQISPKFLKVN